MPKSVRLACVFHQCFDLLEEEPESVVFSSAQEHAICVFIGGKPWVALLDSGSSRTLVRPDCLPRDITFCGKVKVWCVHGDDVDYPSANVVLQVHEEEHLKTSIPDCIGSGYANPWGPVSKERKI